MEENNLILEEEKGLIRISEEVVAIIASVAATQVAGVAGMSGGIAGGIAEILGVRNITKGVKVEVGEREAAIDMYIIVEYGCRIPEVSWDIQEKVKSAVEEQTGLDVVEVNIHVEGVDFERVFGNETSDEEQKN